MWNGMVFLQVLVLALKVCAFATSLAVQGSAGNNLSPSPSMFSDIPPAGEGTPTGSNNGSILGSIAPSATFQSNGSISYPPLVMPPLISTLIPPMVQDPIFSPWSPPPTQRPYRLAPLPTSAPEFSPMPPSPQPGNLQPKERSPLIPQAPVTSVSPSGSSKSDQQTSRPVMPGSLPPNSGRTEAPDNNTHASRSAPEQNASSVSSPPRRSAKPVAGPTSGTANVPSSYSPSYSPGEASSAGEPMWQSGGAPPPHPYSTSMPSLGFNSPASPSPLSTPYHPKIDPKTDFRHMAPSPSSSGSVALPSPIFSPFPSSNSHESPALAPSPASPTARTEIPSISPKISSSGNSSPRNPEMASQPPLQALPPPPPHKDCAPLTCSEPYTNAPPGSPCICVLPMQVGLRLGVALYTFFPLVSELAAEIASGVFMKQSQVRIVGANAAEENPEKTIALIDLVPLGKRFDSTTAYLTFHRFWRKQVAIKTSFFGDYDVLYVRYPGLPPSPPLPPTIGIIGSKPYPGRDNNGDTMKPFGVDVRRKQHKHGLSRSILSIIILSVVVAFILLCAIAWAMLFKYRDSARQADATPPITTPSYAKASGVAGYTLRSGPSSASLGSSIAAYTGSAKTFTASDIERVTDCFNEMRILGEGGFGRVYSGVLEDGTKVAVKILKREDHQGGREFLAEVEMLSRLHHRNLVKLIGICIEDCRRCLVYELIPNGSVESHLHGIDKETAPLDWNARLKIALGAARGLAYLHEDSNPRVIHRDFKSSNILLEEDFTPKVSDFGLARTALDEENRHISTRVMGTFGYVAPEYAMTGHLLVKSDVYSYGVVLLELLTGRKPVDMSQPPGQENLVSWARPLLASREGLEFIIDPSLGPNFPLDSIAKVAAIASMCVQPEVSNRPFMGEVVQALKLICNESDEIHKTGSRSSSDRNLSVDIDCLSSTNSDDHLPDPLLTQSPLSDYDYRPDVENDLSISELLSSSAKYLRQDSESFRRHSSSGRLRTGNADRLWQKMRRLSGGSLSEHGVRFEFWPGSHYSADS